MPCKVSEPAAPNSCLIGVHWTLISLIAFGHEAGDEGDWPEDEQQQDDCNDSC